MKLTEKDLIYILNEYRNKTSLNESMTDIAFHFTNFEGLYGILNSNQFILTNHNDKGQKHASERYPYYMCVTRQKYGDTGYSHQRKDFIVRVTLNGRLLNQRYKTIPYDFFFQNTGKTGFEIDRNRHDGLYSAKPMAVENEERLLSNKPTIPNASKYILRIDILLSKKIGASILKSAINNDELLNKIFIYNDKNNFDLQNKKCKNVSSVVPVNELIKKKTNNGKNLEKLFDDSYELDDNLIAVGIKHKTDDSYNIKYNILNNDMNLVSKTWFDDIYYFDSDNTAKVKLNDKINLINKNGNLIYNTWFDFIYKPNGGFREAIIKHKTYYIDGKGKIYDENKNIIEL